MNSKSFVLLFVATAFLFLATFANNNNGVELTEPRCTSPFCCNYCNMTYVFPDNPCSQVLDALIESANSTENFQYISSVLDPPSVYIVHTTISDCCPPGYIYYEDVLFNMTSTSDQTCSSAIGFSISRSGTCDLGNDQVNIQTMVDGTGLDFEGPNINSGCQK